MYSSIYNFLSDMSATEFRSRKMCAVFFIQYSGEIELYFPHIFYFPRLGSMLKFLHLFRFFLSLACFGCKMDICALIRDIVPVIFV